MARKEDRNTYVSQRTTIDHITGEVLKQEHEYIHKQSAEPDFIKLYLNTLLAFKDLPRTLNPVLVEFLSLMTYADSEEDHGGQIIALTSYLKHRIAKKLDIKINTVEKSLTSFVKTGIFKRIGTGTYQVNPNLFGRGEWKSIKAIRATFDFNSGEVSTEMHVND